MDPKAPASVKHYTATKFNGDYTKASTDEKLAWLDEQPFPGDDTVSLGIVYRRGQNFNGYLHFLQLGLKGFMQNVTAPADSPLFKALSAFISAFNKFVVSFGNELWANTQYILEHGEVRKHAVVIASGVFEMLEAPHPPVVAGPDKKPPTEPSYITAVWDAVRQAVSLLLSQSPLLTTAKADLGGGTYADILEGFLAAGQQFMEVWQEADGRKSARRLGGPGVGEAKSGDEQEDNKMAPGSFDRDQSAGDENVELPELVEAPPVYSLI